MGNFTISNIARARIPRAVFSVMKDAIVGKRYDLSVAVVDARRMRAANFAFRKKNAVTDVLAFPYSKACGEILLHVPSIRKNAKKFLLSCTDYQKYVFIHALLHLKGHVHGRTMEKLEDTWSVAFSIGKISR